MTFIKPHCLHKGDTVAVVSPSWGGPAIFPSIYEHGLRALKSNFGLQIKAMKHTFSDPSFIAQHPEKRADDINHAFADPSVKAIFVSIGGDDSVRILPFLDLELIKKNPKIVMGYSDATTLLTYLNTQGLVTFHGPTIMAGFSQLDSLPKEQKEHIQTMLFKSIHTYTYESFAQFSEGYPDWTKPENVGKVNPLLPHEGVKWLNGSEVCTGELFGGCIEVLEFLKGTTYWPKQDFWKGKVLFFETSEEKPSITQIRRMLRNYASQGIFEKVSAILFGRCRDYSPQEKEEFYAMLIDIIVNEVKRKELLIIANLDFGHTNPQWILPLGCKISLDPTTKKITLLESPNIS